MNVADQPPDVRPTRMNVIAGRLPPDERLLHVDPTRKNVIADPVQPDERPRHADPTRKNVIAGRAQPDAHPTLMIATAGPVQPDVPRMTIVVGIEIELIIPTPYIH